ncbi:MAG TPA: hypothetical protein VMW32_01285, partial [Bacteroidales bacterium]|nr:hypothetical protein [Bacteroidales bacterium]
MRKIIFFRILLCLFFLTLIPGIKSLAQMPQRSGNQPKILGWTDDSHYLIQTYDSVRNHVIRSVDIKTGKGVVVPPEKTDRELLSESLPQGVTLGIYDAVSPDGQSAVIVKDD